MITVAQATPTLNTAFLGGGPPTTVPAGMTVTDTATLTSATATAAGTVIYAGWMEGYGNLEAYPNGNVVHYLDAMGVTATVKNAGRFAMRWAGHCAFWYPLAQLGFLDQAPIPVGNASIAPREFVRRLLEPQLQYAEDERDVAVIRVDVRGIKNGRRRRLLYQVIDLRDLTTGLLAMNRTVGYTASIGAQMILRGDIEKRGLLSPLTDIPTDIFFKELRERGITVEREEGGW
jgi:lysine 6-dehydrogenase